MRKNVPDIVALSAAAMNESQREEVMAWLASASVIELREYLNRIGPLDKWMHRAQNALSIKLADEAKTPH